MSTEMKTGLVLSGGGAAVDKLISVRDMILRIIL